MKRIFYIALLTFLLLACTANAKGSKKKGERPDWLDNPQEKYPAQMYLTAVGEGDSRSAAEDMAAANLSKIFESNVKANEIYNMSYQEISKKGNTAVEEQTNMNTNVNVKSEQTLFNIQFADSYTDDLGRTFSLAYIHRMRTADIYEEKINTNAERVRYYLKEAKERSDTLEKFAYLHAATAFSIKNDQLMAQLSIIQPDAKAFIELGYDFKQVLQLKNEAAGNVVVQIDLKEEDDKTSLFLLQIFNELGFVIGENPALKIGGSIEFEEVDLKRDDYIFVRSTLNMKMKDNKGNVILAYSDTKREGHTTKKEAQERAGRKIRQDLARVLKNKVINYFDSMVTNQ